MGLARNHIYHSDLVPTATIMSLNHKDNKKTSEITILHMISSISANNPRQGIQSTV
jgi:hypothetical protein